jgi:uncharacterized glyoxalase superfamily metalloenzyme YdcJ
MYRGEVPLYGDLVNIVREVDQSLVSAGKSQSLPTRHELERHGAIRLGTELELRTIRRLFAIFGMYAVGYYDLGVVDLPLHATAFRPVTEESLNKNPFRVFTTLLIKERLSPNIAALADSIIAQRNLFTPRLLELIDSIESDPEQAPTVQEVDELVQNALQIFKWHSKTAVSIEQYRALKEEHPIVADIACFPSAHINHLTPRTLDINLVQEEIIKRGMPAKDRIEGPPVRQCPILLRQTSFKALEERVVFTTGDGSFTDGTHTARFGEVEQRGAAVTPKGRQLYDQLLNLTIQSMDAATSGSNDTQHGGFDVVLAENFSRGYPDSWSELLTQGLVYFRFEPSASSSSSEAHRKLQSNSKINLFELLSLGLVEYEPITYEDFLPFSAAGIFKSNISESSDETTESESVSSVHEHGAIPESKAGWSDKREDLENALGCNILDESELYASLQQESIKKCEMELGLEEIIMP